MPLVFNKSLTKNLWITHPNIPDIKVGDENNYCFNYGSKKIFKKIKPDFKTPIFNRSDKHKNITISDDYLSCTGTVSRSPISGCGIKSYPLIKHDKLLFFFQIKSMGSGYPMIGFCDKDSKVDNTTNIIDSVVWTLNEPVVKYFKNGIIDSFQPVFSEYKNIKNNDIIGVAIDIEKNKIWVSVNYKWGIDKPNTIGSKTADLFLPYLKNIDPILYVVPSGCEIEIIKPKIQLPSLFEFAKSEPVLDWYLDEVHNKEEK